MHRNKQRLRPTDLIEILFVALFLGLWILGDERARECECWRRESWCAHEEKGSALFRLLLFRCCRSITARASLSPSHTYAHTHTRSRASMDQLVGKLAQAAMHAVRTLRSLSLSLSLSLSRSRSLDLFDLELFDLDLFDLDLSLTYH